MPMLDVTDVILDPMFCQMISVTRRQQVTNSNGQVSVVTQSLNPIGVITINTPNALAQEVDYTLGKGSIIVHCTIQLYDAVISYGTPYQPDLINYNGNPYIVTKAYNWSQYGRGFTMSECELYTMENAGN
jgi:hypothetical protein